MDERCHVQVKVDKVVKSRDGAGGFACWKDTGTLQETLECLDVVASLGLGKVAPVDNGVSRGKLWMTGDFDIE